MDVDPEAWCQVSSEFESKGFPSRLDYVGFVFALFFWGGKTIDSAHAGGSFSGSPEGGGSLRFRIQSMSCSANDCDTLC